MVKKYTRDMLTDKPVIKVCYCGAYYLLKGLERVGYMSGVYGWNCDVYDCEAAYIVTGYRFYGIRGQHANYEMIDHANDICKKLLEWNAAGIDINDKLETISNIRRDYIALQLMQYEK